MYRDRIWREKKGMCCARIESCWTEEWVERKALRVRSNGQRVRSGPELMKADRLWCRSWRPSSSLGPSQSPLSLYIYPKSHSVFRAAPAMRSILGLLKFTSPLKNTAPSFFSRIMLPFHLLFFKKRGIFSLTLTSSLNNGGLYPK